MSDRAQIRQDIETKLESYKKMKEDLIRNANLQAASLTGSIEALEAALALLDPPPPPPPPPPDDSPPDDLSPDDLALDALLPDEPA